MCSSGGIHFTIADKMKYYMLKRIYFFLFFLFLARSEWNETKI